MASVRSFRFSCRLHCSVVVSVVVPVTVLVLVITRSCFLAGCAVCAGWLLQVALIVVRFEIFPLTKAIILQTPQGSRLRQAWWVHFENIVWVKTSAVPQLNICTGQMRISTPSKLSEASRAGGLFRRRATNLRATRDASPLGTPQSQQKHEANVIFSEIQVHVKHHQNRSCQCYLGWIVR